MPDILIFKSLVIIIMDLMRAFQIVDLIHMNAIHECILQISGELASCCLEPLFFAGGPDRSGSQ